MPQIYGYIRVSTKEQNEDRQVDALSEHHIAKENLYFDKQSGKNFKRPAYQMLIKKLQPGDILVVKSIDRLGRNYEEILEQWRLITKEIQANIRVLDMPLLDTSIQRDLTGTLISDIVLQILSYMAQNERENIRQRQAEGIAAAKARGMKFGRPEKKLPQNFLYMVQKWQNKELSAFEVSAELGISTATFYRKVKKMKQCME